MFLYPFIARFSFSLLLILLDENDDGSNEHQRDERVSKMQNLDFLRWLCKCCDVFMCLLNACSEIIFHFLLAPN